MEENQPTLMDLIQGDDFFQRVLVVESSPYIELLKKRFPNAEIFLVTDDESEAEKYSHQVKTFFMDYRKTRLPFEEEFFDAIIGDLTLETVYSPEDIAAGFSGYLKQTGFFLTSFRNLRHWQVLKQLMNGHFEHFVEKLYTRKDFEKLLMASFYKSVLFMARTKKAPPKILNKLIECGFENFSEDLETEIFLVRAERSTPEVALLKSLYTPEIRAELSRLLHRIEYDVDAEENVKTLAEFCAANEIFGDYLEDFVEEAVFHKANFYANLRKFLE